MSVTGLIRFQGCPLAIGWDVCGKLLDAGPALFGLLAFLHGGLMYSDPSFSSSHSFCLGFVLHFGAKSQASASLPPVGLHALMTHSPVLQFWSPQDCSGRLKPFVFPNTFRIIAVASQWQHLQLSVVFSFVLFLKLMSQVMASFFSFLLSLSTPPCLLSSLHKFVDWLYSETFFLYYFLFLYLYFFVLVCILLAFFMGHGFLGYWLTGDKDVF